jgi:hypothetical protein
LVFPYYDYLHYSIVDSQGVLRGPDCLAVIWPHETAHSDRSALFASLIPFPGLAQEDWALDAAVKDAAVKDAAVKDAAVKDAAVKGAEVKGDCGGAQGRVTFFARNLKTGQTAGLDADGFDWENPGGSWAEPKR